TAVLRVLERAVPQQGEGIQRRPLPCVVPLEPPAGDPTRITAAAGAIDPLTTRSQPGSELLKTLTHGVGQPPLRVRTNTDEVIAAAGDDLDQIAQDLLDGLGGVVPAQRAPGPRHRDARLPRMPRVLLGQGLLRGAVVLVRPVHLAVHDEDVRLELTRPGGAPVDADRLVRLPHPPR